MSLDAVRAHTTGAEDLLGGKVYRNTQQNDMQSKSV